MGFLDRVKASYARLEAKNAEPEAVEPPQPKERPAPKKCSLCENPAWTNGICAHHALEEVRALAKSRRKAGRLERRGQFFRAKRAARRAGDWALWNELCLRSRTGKAFPSKAGPTAYWRKKWAHVSGPVKP